VGLERPDSVPNLTRRVAAHRETNPQPADELGNITSRILRETKNKG
jgi:hypothetical protein